MSDAAAWDARYAEGGFAFGEAPNRYLEAQSARLRPGMRALAIGDGEGRNGAWLAGRGLDVTAVDWSATGLAKAEKLAQARGVPLRTVVADLTAWNWPRVGFDLVAWIFVHLPPADRALVAARAAEALAPGGLLVLEAFTPAQEGRRSGGPRDPDLLWSAALVRRHFAGLEMLECLEGTVLLDEGPKHQGHAEVVRALLRRP
ncbi:methyltransferase domain-containing protein [Roseomonas sp. SSH11]|uniref:Methyltransferase domain-containing protein n=1 Tax=Pararoseomonas baculiformis TaxID=2820812 RepID=A0ABS4ACH7_9PROT|nr:class I SAM-dependent methyltransferase [Pararoseomonas baculiformis]MBP0444705.1 methyltransferase domain-containing protein [Pararoseomonas baculiformis]